MSYEAADAEDRADQAQRELDEATDRIKELEAEVAEWKKKYETLHTLASNAYDATSHHLNALWNTL